MSTHSIWRVNPDGTETLLTYAQREDLGSKLRHHFMNPAEIGNTLRVRRHVYPDARPIEQPVTFEEKAWLEAEPREEDPARTAPDESP